MKKVIKTIEILLFVLAIVIFSSTNWALTNYSIESFDQIIYTLRTSVGDASKEILIDFSIKCIIIPILIVVIILILLNRVNVILKKIDYILNIRIRNKKVKINFNKLFSIKYINNLFPLIFLFLSMTYAITNLGIVSYLINNVETSTFFQENYINPKNVEITFPEEKKNLIHIFVESMENTYSSVENGGAYNINYIPNFSRIAKENINFSATNNLGGAYVTDGAT